MSALSQIRSIDNVYVIETIPALPGKDNELRAELCRLVPLCQQEKGCISYELFQDRANPTLFTVIMKWDHAVDYDAHNKVSHIADFVKTFRNVLYKDDDILERTYQKLT